MDEKERRLEEMEKQLKGRVPDRMKHYQEGFRDGQATLVPPARVTAAQLATELMKAAIPKLDKEQGVVQSWQSLFNAILEKLEGGK